MGTDHEAARALLQSGVSAHKEQRLKDAEDFYVRSLAGFGIALPPSPELIEPASAKEVAQALLLLGQVRIQSVKQRGGIDLGVTKGEDAKASSKAELEVATACIRLALASLPPEFHARRWKDLEHLAKALLELKRLDKDREQELSEERVCVLREIAKLRPDHPTIFYRLGLEIRHFGEAGEAASFLEEHVKNENASAKSVDAAKHWIAILRGDDTAAAPAGYVAGLFDSYADRFEDHLVNKLCYQTPELLAKDIRRFTPTAGLGRCADLGAGTGLMGPPIRDIGVRLLEGVDLSEAMLRKAQEKGDRGVGYDRLVCGDLLAIFTPPNRESTGSMAPIESVALESCGSPTEPEDRFDSVIAADVFVYVGDLCPVFEATSRWLSPGGIFAFSTEMMPSRRAGETKNRVEKDFELRDTGRYVHSVPFVSGLAEKFAFDLLVRRTVVLRYNAGEPVRGHIWVYVKTA